LWRSAGSVERNSGVMPFGALRRLVRHLSKIERTERTCVVKRGCVFSTILWVIIIVVVLLALGYFARGRRR
jgi:hypothetical protein